MRCQILRKDGLGDIHIHTRWWWPSRIQLIGYQPEGREVFYEVPAHLYEEFARVDTLEQAMALLRKSEPG